MDTLFFRNPRLVILALAVIAVAGLSALLTLGRQEDPSITGTQAGVTTLFPGADPARIEALITRPLENELRTIAEVMTLSSTSAAGISSIDVELIETIDPAAIPEVWSRVRDKVAAVPLPPGALDPEVETGGEGAYAAILALLPKGDTAPASAVLGRHAQELAERLRTLTGAKSVDVWGLPAEEVLVALDPARTAALGLSPAEVATAVAAGDAKARAGRLTGPGTEAVLDLAGDISGLDRVRDIVLREGSDGSVLRVGDVAEVTRGPRPPGDALAMVDGRAAVLIGVRIEEGLRVDLWMEGLKAKVAAFADTLPASLEVRQVFDQAVYTADRMSEVAVNMAIGTALVIAVLFLTLGARAALVVALVLPLVTLATLGTMRFIGLPLHQMSVTGLIVALGLLVDAAIVMTDEVQKRLSEGQDRRQAVAAAVRRLAVPLLASTLTTVLSFVPMILLPGGAGDFISAIAIAVVLMLSWSLIVALTITPALAGWWLSARGGAGLRLGALTRGFAVLIQLSLANPLRSVLLALVLPVMGFLAMPMLVPQFFPGVDRNQFHVEVELPVGTGLETTRALVERIDSALKADARITGTVWVAGESAPAFYYNIVGNRQNAPEYAHGLVTTTSPAATAALLGPLQADLSEAFPQARVLVRGLVQGPPVDAPVELRLVGQDIQALRRAGDDIRTILLSVPALTQVRTQMEGTAPEVRVDVDEAAARLLGLSLGDVSAQLQAALEGVTGGALLEGTEELPVRVRLGEDIRGDLSRIATLPILPAGAAARATQGALPQVPLSALATLTLVPSETAISRRNGDRVNTVQAFVAPGVLAQAAQAQAEAALAQAGFVLPPGVTLEIGGDADERSQTVANLMASIGLIVTLSVATVVLSFNSFRLSAITFAVAGLSAGLSILALAIFDHPFGITAVIGVIGSIGVSVNAAIIVLSALQEDPRAAAGDRAAMTEVVMGSTRHILSTTLTTVGGFLPLILAGGGFWPPFAVAVAGGVALSTVLAFAFTPQMFALVHRRVPLPSALATAPTASARQPP
ncbi:MAG: efflux RND transporter permease subunit [Pseudomonadota bacterium]|jgi:multidrug efflux pump subunit AcrB|nr:efflux RND transporter permease subunit [Rubrivivax sp.]MCZ8030720.1 efflux RND transporter permease subunit [Rubrivivax sp.]